MDRQMSHLDEIARLPNASIRIIPWTVGSHAGLYIDRFVLLEFGKLPTTGLIEPPVVYAEGFTGDLYLERDCEVDPYRRALRDLDRVALDEDRSRTLMGEIARDYRA